MDNEKKLYHIVESRDIMGEPVWFAYPDKKGWYEMGTHVCVSAESSEECKMRLRLVLMAPRIVETVEI